MLIKAQAYRFMTDIKIEMLLTVHSNASEQAVL